MVPSLSHNIESQTHSRVSECDGRPPVQVQPGAIDRMVTASTSVQTNLPKVVHSSCRPVCHSSEPQTEPQSHCLIIVIAPGWPGMPWFWDLVQLSTEIPLQLPVSTTLLWLLCGGGRENCCSSLVINKNHLQIKVGPI